MNATLSGRSVTRDMPRDSHLSCAALKTALPVRGCVRQTQERCAASLAQFRSLLRVQPVRRVPPATRPRLPELRANRQRATPRLVFPTPLPQAPPFQKAPDVMELPLNRPPPFPLILAHDLADH